MAAAPHPTAVEAPGPGPGRTRSAYMALLLGGVLLALSIPLAGASGPHVASSPAAAAPAAGGLVPATGRTVTAPQRYRVVGCVSHGEGAVREGPRRREVAIGFDDGPWALTPRFVTMLERAGVRATFFMIGRQVSPAWRSTMLRALRNGDIIGDHTWSHPDLTRSGEVREQLRSTIAAIRAQTGYTPCVLRPPYGASDPGVRRTARSLGLSTILWNVDPTDWADPGTAAIVGRVLTQVKPGSIVISHDGGGNRSQTLAAYPQIIRALKARGYRIVTLLEMLGFHPVYVPCIKLCNGIALRRSQLPPGAIIRPAA